MICPDCNGSGAVQVYNTQDDSGDALELRGMCAGEGYIGLTDDESTEV